MLENIPKEQKYIILGLMAIILIGSGLALYNRLFPSSDSKEILIEAPDLEVTPEKKEIIVHISGAVKNCGVYRLEEGQRMVDALKAAGGATKTADLSKINLAQLLIDGQKIVIPPKQWAASTKGRIPSHTSSSSSSGQININTADAKTLDTIPGIGPSTAKKIIDYREGHGSFKSTEEIMQVPGIGKGKFEKLKKLITVY